MILYQERRGLPTNYLDIFNFVSLKIQGSTISFDIIEYYREKHT